MRYIDADNLAKFIDYGHLSDPNDKVYSENDIREMIDMMPTVDIVLDFTAKTPKHGHWIWSETACEGNPYGRYVCSNCAMNHQPHKTKYCSYCGALMDEGEVKNYD